MSGGGSRPHERGAFRLAAAIAIAVAVSGCGGFAFVPNQDHGSSGCQNARGIGQQDAAVELAPVLMGMSPAEAAATARSHGHTVVFNVPITGYGECWCIPPPEGEVVEAWYGQHGALWLMIDGVDEGHTPDVQPARGWGC
jgi:hypothetical protein